MHGYNIQWKVNNWVTSGADWMEYRHFLFEFGLEEAPDDLSTAIDGIATDGELEIDEANDGLAQSDGAAKNVAFAVDVARQVVTVAHFQTQLRLVQVHRRDVKDEALVEKRIVVGPQRLRRVLDQLLRHDCHLFNIVVKTF